MPHATQNTPEQEYKVVLEHEGKYYERKIVARNLGQAQDLARYAYCRENKIPSDRWLEVRVVNPQLPTQE